MNTSTSMQRNPWKRPVLATALLIAGGLLTACSDSGGTSSTAARHQGEIEQLGSIFVNGVKFETEGATIVGPDVPKVGMVVKVDGAVNADGATGTASSVSFDDNVTGPMTAAPTVNGGVTTADIMGQTVVFEDNLTKFDAGTAKPIAGDVNKVFMISGFERDDGKIQATFAKKAADDQALHVSAGGLLEITGTVTALGATTFQINGLTVDFSGAPAPAGLANGVLVEAKGVTFDSVTNTLTATSIEVKVAGMGDDFGKVHVEGMVTDLAGSTFTVNGQLVDASNAKFRIGDPIDLVNGAKVEAEGPISNGVLVATRITFKASVRLEAAVEAVNGNTVTFMGLPGIAVLVHDELTRDDAAAFATLAVGNDVKVRARQGASALVATRLEKTGDAADRTIIRGPVTAISGADVTVLKTVVVDTSTALGGPAVMAVLKVGDVVKARFRNGVWDQIELELDD